MDGEILTVIMDRLEELVPELQWIDIDEGQLSSPERPSVAFPCCLADMSYVQCDDHKEALQRVRGQITLRVAFKRLGSTNTAAPRAMRTRSMDNYNTLQSIHKALQWWEGNGKFGKLRRLSVRPERRSDLRVFVMTYETTFAD
jgi:hypothetical protein